MSGTTSPYCVMPTPAPRPVGQGATRQSGRLDRGADSRVLLTPSPSRARQRFGRWLGAIRMYALADTPAAAPCMRPGVGFMLVGVTREPVPTSGLTCREALSAGAPAMRILSSGAGIGNVSGTRDYMHSEIAHFACLAQCIPVHVPVRFWRVSSTTGAGWFAPYRMHGNEWHGRVPPSVWRPSLFNAGGPVPDERANNRQLARFALPVVYLASSQFLPRSDRQRSIALSVPEFVRWSRHA